MSWDSEILYRARKSSRKSQWNSRISTLESESENEVPCSSIYLRITTERGSLKGDNFVIRKFESLPENSCNLHDWKYNITRSDLPKFHILHENHLGSPSEIRGYWFLKVLSLRMKCSVVYSIYLRITTERGSLKGDNFFIRKFESFPENSRNLHDWK